MPWDRLRNAGFAVAAPIALSAMPNKDALSFLQLADQVDPFSSDSEFGHLTDTGNLAAYEVAVEVTEIHPEFLQGSALGHVIRKLFMTPLKLTDLGSSSGR